MAKPVFSLRTLLEAGVHLGHQTHRWNPQMAPYIHSKKNGIHIIDLTQTVPLLIKALKVIEETAAKGGSVLFVGTKRQVQLPIEKAAKDSAQHYVNHRWLGGTLTNWKTVSNSISRLEELDEKIEDGLDGLTKKERLGLLRDQAKLQASLGGIRNMNHIPDIIFIVDVKKENLAIAEANKLGIPVVAVVDTNCSPEGVAHIIPGNDDAIRSVSLYCELVSKAVLEGMTTQMGEVGVDLGALEGPEEVTSLVPEEEKKDQEKPEEVEAEAENGVSDANDQSELENTEESSSEEGADSETSEEKSEDRATA
ncbi:MAG: 30S ribosomal protein S2 [Rhodobacteraceae bacterium]|nr:30S ribosomal protein S2 [Paracoccaceae bacterium]MCY4249211.1 30S ribosomal protein S2 [Paracoccaceae bacterium]